MPTNDTPPFDFSDFADGFARCCAGFDSGIQPQSVQPAPQPVSDAHLGTGSAADLEPLPDFFKDKAWRKRATEERAKFPAGYTYFAQLVGHDIGNSVLLADVPHAQTPPPEDAKAQQGESGIITRYNLIENPLTLETVYGQGPSIATHLYDPATLKFAIARGHTITQPFSKHFKDLRAIHDNRNRDTVMLHRITASIMKYHNKIVDEIEPDGRKLRAASGRAKLEIFNIARSHMIDVWHALIRDDLMRVILVDTVAPNPEVTLTDTTLLHAVFRVFHGLPRSEYQFAGQSFSLKDLLASSLSVTPEDTERWAIDWVKFFDTAQGGNKTGVSASVTGKLARGAQNLPKLDALTVRTTNPLRLDDPRISVFVDALPAADRAKITHTQLAQDFTAKYGIEIAPKTIGSGSLFFALMIEAHLHGPDGKLGPLGSFLFASALEKHMQSIQKRNIPDTLSLSMPGSMLELLQTVND